MSAEATLIRTPHGPVVVVDGRAHTLRALLGVDAVTELAGQEAADFLQNVVDNQYATAVG